MSIYITFFKLSQEKIFNNNNRKSVSTFNFSLVFVGEIKSNFHYNKNMTKKMYDNLQEKYKNNKYF